MNESGQWEPEETHFDRREGEDASDLLPSRISRVLHERASQVHFTAAQRAQILQRLPARSPLLLRRRRGFLPAFSLAAAVLVILSVVTLLVVIPSLHTPAPTASIIFSLDKTFNTPPQLASGGQPVLLDPSGRHIVYGVVNQTGDMYTSDLADPITSNRLAMQFARDVSWSPDGSALVTTIYPPAVSTPLLALVQTGHYMHTLGKEALAAAWLPTSAQIITYITQVDGQATLWEIMPNGKDAHSIGTMSLPTFTQSLRWSPDGRYLAILASAGKVPTRAQLQGPSQAIYIYDTHSGTLIPLVPTGGASIIDAAWSPVGNTFTYVMKTPQGHTTIKVVDITTYKTLFTLLLQRQFLGMSWSPDGRALVYSDGGVLNAHVVYGKSIVFSNVKSSADYPIWRDNQHLLYLSVNNGTRQLAQMAANASH
ncbi:MAG: PD40 domain-containing protein [Ktedonobacteraceae bacterium]|nr:PD40 domain-containing protein [Ktedonobacteraceae bacterium]